MRSDTPDAGAGHTLEIAHVLFTDIVGYSKLPMDEQEQLVMQLQQAVRQTPEFVRAEASEELIRIPTGDGMALVFFRDAEAPVRCALELSQFLRNHSELKLRMGIHSGPVYRVADINANRNVAGGGINIAQRVMDSGDAGHILVSSAEAEVLGQISCWSHTLHDLGEVEVKHGVRLHIYNLYNIEVGNPELPKKIATLTSLKTDTRSRTKLKKRYLPKRIATQRLMTETGSRTDVKKRYLPVTVGTAVFVLTLIGSWLLFTHKAHALGPTDTIVLADFSNMTGDEVFDDALRPALTVDLRQSPYLNILSENKVNLTLQEMTHSPRERLTQDLAREVCQRTGSKAYLAGSIAELGTQYVINLEALNCETGDVLAQEQVTASGKEQVVPALGRAASKLRNRLGESLSSVQKYDVPLEQATTNSLVALKAYSLGRKTLNEEAIKRAIELDPNFAMAYDLLGNLYINLNQPSVAADNLKKAFDLRNRVTEFERFHITADYYDIATGELEKANQTYELWIQLYPHDYDALVNLGSDYMILGEYEKAADVNREVLQLDPTSGQGYVNLGEIYLALNRFDEARITTEEASGGLFGGFNLHVNMYALAYLQGNVAAMKQQADWARGKSGVEDQMFSLESDTEAWSGRLGKARKLSRQAVETAHRSEKKEAAALWQANAAIREALFGNDEEARQNAAAAVMLAPGSRDAEAQAALAYALAGDIVHAESIVDDLANRFPQDTVVQSVWLPTIRAQVQTGRKDAADGIELLQAATPYELGMLSPSATNSCLYPMYVRAEAYLSAQQAAAAVAEFQRILDQRGLLWNCATGTLAHLGLARAFAAQGDTAKAQAAYQDFLAAWKDADPDIPVLVAAKSEYAKLQ
jgi:tetratricopeptide (TPR) repeat protein/class 3 adenylate cyclase